MVDKPSWAATDAPPAWAAPTAPAPPPPKPSRAPPGMLAEVGDFFSGVKDRVVDELTGLPQRRAAARADYAADHKDGIMGAPRRLYAAGKGAVTGALEEGNQAARDFHKTAGENDSSLLHAGKTALSALGVPIGYVGGAIKGSGLGRDMQAATGLRASTASDLVAGALPLGELSGANKLMSKISGGVKEGSAYAGKFLNPAGVDSQAHDTASLHRMAIGTRRAEADADMHALNTRKLQSVVGNAPVEDQHLLARYIDTRSTGSVKLPSKYQAAADAIRDTNMRYRSRIENVLGDSDNGGPAFVNDYYARLWKNPPKDVQTALSKTGYGGGVQGSSRSLRARTIPSYEEGLKAGLTPVFTNPLDATRAYVDNMASFLATHDIRNSMLDKGIAKWVPERSIPPDWKRLGSETSPFETRTRKFIADGKPQASREVLAAPENAARIYNNHVSKGLEGTLGGPVYQGARKAANTLTQAKLSLSAFHAMTMGQEGIVSGVKDAFKAVSRVPGQAAAGDLRGAGRSALTAGKELAKAPLSPITKAVTGSKLRSEILDPTISKGLDPRIAKAYTEAGGRATMDRFYSSNSNSADFFQALKRGTFKRDLMDSVRAVGDANGVLGKAGKSIELGAKLLETSMAPIFKEYIPRVKAGAFADEMGAWYKLNPNATTKEAQHVAEKIVDSIDNRFGEMVTDNQFWHRSMTQAGQLLLLSPSWDFGTAHLAHGAATGLGDSMKGLMSGKGVTDPVAYAGALAATTAVLNGVYTRMATGEQPTGADYLAARTGGTDAKGQPERVMMPGYMKDVLAFHNDPQTAIENKANPALSAMMQLWSNKDYFGRPIVRPRGVAPTTDTAQAGLDRPVDIGKFLLDAGAPISLESKGAPNANSKIGPLGHFLGMKQAPSYLEDPDGVARNTQKYEGREWKAKLKGDARREARSEQSTEPADATPSWAAPGPPSWADPSQRQGPAIKPGATSGGNIRPEFKPIVDYVTGLHGFKEITAENDLYHPATDVHGQGRAMDFTIKGGRAAAADFVATLRRNLKAQGFSAHVIDEYNHPSANATGGHVHVSIV